MSQRECERIIVIVSDNSDSVGENLHRVVRRMKIRNALRFIWKCLLAFWILLIVCVIICLI